MAALESRPVQDRLLAAQIVRAWGFPREVTQLEIDEGSWFMLGSRVIWWYEAELKGYPGTRFLHLAVAPECRPGRWPVRRWLELVYLEAVRLGARRVVVAPMDNSGHVLSYLCRLGWSRAGPLMFRELGGVD